MKKRSVDYSVYLCTDRELMSCNTLEECVELALSGGAGVVQLREKNCSGREFYESGRKIKPLTEKYGVPLIINDRVDVALALNADGVHLGQEDLACSVVRRLVPEDMLVGVSVSCVDEAVKAEQDGADYLGVGAMYATDTKTDAKIVSLTELEAIRRAVKLPIVVIGGLNKHTLVNFKNKGIDGIAVVSAIVAQPDIKKAAEELVRLWKS